MEHWKLSLTTAREKIARGELTSVELTKSCLERIDQLEDKLNAFTWVNKEGALKQAEEADKMIAEGKGQPLTGIPVAIKDVLMSEDDPTTASSNILKGYKATYSATGVEKILEQGAVVIGKVNCDAFAHGSSTENSDYGPSKNPWDLSRVPGGSSGGSAAAVSAGMALYSLGTDTGGSIRQPAAYCNLVGFKPTYGRVSRSGLISMTSSTDCLSVITRDVNDAAVVMEAISGEDILDATTARVPVPSYYGNTREAMPEKVKIGVPRDLLNEGLDENVKNVIEESIAAYKEMGAEIIDISLPHAHLGVAVYYIITPSEVSSNLERFDGIRYGYSATNDSENQPHSLNEVYTKTRGKGFNAENKRRIMMGTYALSSGYYDAYYQKASKVRTLIIEDFNKAFEKVDLILTPTTPGTAFKIGEKVADPLAMYLEDIFLAAVSLAGLPAVSIQAGFAKAQDDENSNLPVGIQLVGKALNETMLFKTAKAFELKHNFHKHIPEL